MVEHWVETFFILAQEWTAETKASHPASAFEMYDMAAMEMDQLRSLADQLDPEAALQ